MERPGSVWALVVAAGTGSRFGGLKQYERVGGRQVLDWSVQAARSAAQGVVVVVPPGDVGSDELADVGADAVVGGGVSRSGSVRAGLAAVPAHVDIIVVHDAARPVATPALFGRVVKAICAGADAAVPVVPVVDSVRHRNGFVVDRTELLAVQTPQAFRAAALRAAHISDGEATDDASLVEAAGGRLVVVDGERWNVKITERSDLAVVTALLAAR